MKKSELNTRTVISSEFAIAKRCEHGNQGWKVSTATGGSPERAIIVYTVSVSSSRC